MNRKLMAGLAAVLAAALYLSTQPEDDLLAPGKDGAPRAHAQGPQSHGGPDEDAAPATPRDGLRVPERQADRAAQKADLAPWVGQALLSGVTRWQARPSEVLAPAPGRSALLAWGGNSPPPQPPPPLAHAEPPPPPPPVAPRFPHAWVGRFNDEPVAAAASGVSRAVLSGPQTTWVVRAGDVIEGQWRIDRIQDRSLSLTYLPLQQQQTVTMK